MLRKFLCWIGWHEYKLYRERIWTGSEIDYVEFDKCQYCGKVKR